MNPHSPAIEAPPANPDLESCLLDIRRQHYQMVDLIDAIEVILAGPQPGNNIAKDPGAVEGYYGLCETASRESNKARMIVGRLQTLRGMLSPSEFSEVDKPSYTRGTVTGGVTLGLGDYLR
jgi:hypothetical protein